MLSEILKAQTSVNHLLLEKKLIGFMRTIHSENDYANFLKLFYGYFASLELLIDEELDRAILPDYESRRKTQAIRADLNILGFDNLQLADKLLLPLIKNNLQSLGALYVIEGSTLGGKIISKMIQDQLHTGLPVFSFFTGYGEHSVSMWNTFKETLNNITDPDSIAIILATANDTFLRFSNWFDHNQQAVNITY